MGYVRRYISACEGFGWTGGPVFNTRIVRMANGRERRNADQDQPQHVFSVPFSNISQKEYAPIKNMHLNRRGQWGAFLFRDRLDEVASNEVFAIAPGGVSTFQLAKWSIQEGVEYRNTIHAIYSPSEDGSPINSPLVVTINGVATTSYAVDRDTGAITFTSAPSNGAILRWSGGFSRWVRFARDDLPFSIDNKGAEGFFINGSVDLLEMPPPSDGETVS